ncbi:MAG: hypothetical protein QM699_15575 [Amaricoccus sp.]|uniref:hypothetical protein n=1 Tax=Amaricoccus sp. TaxID=1872485 RepID=UPI0039E4851F
MAARTAGGSDRGGGGFWRGFLAGLVLALLVGLTLAWAFPPLKAPDVDETRLAAPDGLVEPAGIAHPGAATPEVGLPERAGPAATPEPGPDRAP